MTASTGSAADRRTVDRDGFVIGYERLQDRTYTHPDVLTVGVRDGWADPETDPTRIEWPTRQASAAIAFEVVDGRPVNPVERTAVRYGRNELGHWGEALAADALVSVTDLDGCRWIVDLAQPKRTATPAQMRALAAATRARRTCPTCRIVRPYIIPRSLGECLTCTEDTR